MSSGNSFTWTDGVTGDFGTASDWSGDAVPNGGNNASISGTETETVTVSTNETVNGLTLDDANATLAVTNNATLTVYGPLTAMAVQAINVSGYGSLLVGGGSTTLDGFTLNLGATQTASGVSSTTSGVLETNTSSQSAAVLTLGPKLIVNVVQGDISTATSSGDGLDNQGTINTTDSLWIDTGAFSNEGSINGGSLKIGGETGFTNSGVISAPSVVLYDDANGTATVTQPTLLNTGSVLVNGSENSSYIDGYTALLDNEGTIAATDGATLWVEISGANNGVISAGAGGRIVVADTLGGTGALTIDDGGVVEISSGPVSDGATFAAGGVGTLQLDDATSFTGTISGLLQGDTIDFAEQTVTADSLSGSTLTVTFSGGATENLTLATPLPTGDSFQLQIDGAGGTELVVSNGPLPPLPTELWTDGVTGDFGTAADWLGNTIPAGVDNAAIAGTGAETVTVSTNESINGLTLNDANATLALTNEATLSVYGPLTATAIQAINVSGYASLLIGGGSTALDGFTLNLGASQTSNGISSTAAGTLETNFSSLSAAFLTLGPHLTVNVGQGYIETGTSPGDGLDNQATINTTGNLFVNTGDFSNEGSITGGSLSIDYEIGFSNSNIISASSLELYDFTGGVNNETLSTFLNTGSILANGSGVSSEMTGGFAVLDNEGTIAATNGASLYVDLSGVNNGAISAGSGSRIVVAASLSGTGALTIDNGGVVEISSGQVSDGATFAAGGVGTLQLDDATSFTGTISGLAPGDVIDFANQTVTADTLSGSTLTVNFAGGVTESLTLATPLPTGDSLQPQIDGAGGTELVVSNGPLPPPATALWKDGVTGDFGTAADWTGNAVPTGINNAAIAGTGTETVTVSTNETVNDLTLDDANATLAVTNNANLTLYGGLSETAIKAIDVSDYGSLLVGGGSTTLDGFTLNLGGLEPEGPNVIAVSGRLETDTASPDPAVLTLGPHMTIDVLNIGDIQTGTSSGDGLDNEGVINAPFDNLSISTGAFSNEGSITGETNLTINAYTGFTNSGVISAASVELYDNATGTGPSTSGTTAVTQPTLLNTGSIFVNEWDFSSEISGGTALLDNEGTIAATNDAHLTLDLSGVNNGVISAAAGGQIVVEGSLSGTGALAIDNGGVVEISSGTVSNGVTFASGGVGTLQLDNTTSFTGSIFGLAQGDIIDFAKQTVTGDTLSGSTLTVTFSGGATENLTLATPLPTGDNFQLRLDGAGGTELVVQQTICFMAGTMIRTPDGETPIEKLRAGDLVMTANGETKPVEWLGRQTISALFADPIRSWPIRVKAGALGENAPCRDLFLSPDHALLVGDVLIHAGALVNGTSIVREARVPEKFVYYHVELDDHALILAENTPAETFVDNVDRLAFDNWGEHEALYPKGKPIEEMHYPRAKSRRQVPVRILAALDERARLICTGGVMAVA